MVEPLDLARSDAGGVEDAVAPHAIGVMSPTSVFGVRAEVQGGMLSVLVHQDEGRGIELHAVRKIERSAGPPGGLLSKTTDGV